MLKKLFSVRNFMFLALLVTFILPARVVFDNNKDRDYSFEKSESRTLKIKLFTQAGIVREPVI